MWSSNQERRSPQDAVCSQRRTLPPLRALEQHWFQRRSEMRQMGSQRNSQEQVEALVRLLLEPAGRRQRHKVSRYWIHELWSRPAQRWA